MYNVIYSEHVRTQTNTGTVLSDTVLSIKLPGSHHTLPHTLMMMVMMTMVVMVRRHVRKRSRAVAYSAYRVSAHLGGGHTPVARHQECTNRCVVLCRLCQRARARSRIRTENASRPSWPPTEHSDIRTCARARDRETLARALLRFLALSRACASAITAIGTYGGAGAAAHSARVCVCL